MNKGFIILQKPEDLFTFRIIRLGLSPIFFKKITAESDYKARILCKNFLLSCLSYLWAGGPSIIMLIHKICMAFSGLGSFKNVEILISDIAAMLLNNIQQRRS